MANPLDVLKVLMNNPYVQNTVVNSIAASAVDELPQQGDLLTKALLTSPAANAIESMAAGIKSIPGKVDVAMQEAINQGKERTFNENNQQAQKRAAQVVDTKRSSSGKIGVAATPELDAVLLSLATSNPTQPLPTVPGPAGTTVVPSAAQQVADYKAKLQAAYPDQAINIQLDPKTGKITGEMGGMGKGPAVTTIPNYDPTKVASGIDLIKAQLAKPDITDSEKLDLAVKLKVMAADQATHNYNKYVKQADLRFGVTDIEAAIASVKQAEAMDPRNPGNGMPSNERMALLTTLGQTRAYATQYVNELVHGDSTVNEAKNLADSIIATFNLADNKIKLDELKVNEQMKVQQKTELLANPRLLTRLIGVNGGTDFGDAARSIAADSVVRGKAKIDDFTKSMISADPTELYNNFFDPTLSPDKRQKIKNILRADEVVNTGDPALAARRLEILDRVMTANLDNPMGEAANVLGEQYKPQVSDALKARKGAIDKEAAASRLNPKSNKEKDAERARIDIETKKKLLGIMATEDFNGNVFQWKGVIQSDPTAVALLSKADKSKPMSAAEFITSYINMNSGKSLKEKSNALRGMVETAVGAVQNGAILPPPKADSMLLLLDKIAVQSLTTGVRNNYMENPFSLSL